mmetsp:Transcript_24748/g.79702  ORF Transcript_24748/g.79702 Transcript_24748/m.79702 type:complete len:255 (-) Transcript_24748:59-823(-)
MLSTAPKQLIVVNQLPLGKEVDQACHHISPQRLDCLARIRQGLLRTGGVGVGSVLVQQAAHPSKVVEDAVRDAPPQLRRLLLQLLHLGHVPVALEVVGERVDRRQQPRGLAVLTVAAGHLQLVHRGDQHLKLAQRGARRRQVALGIIQLLDVCTDFLHQVLRLLRLGPDGADLEEQLADGGFGLLDVLRDVPPRRALLSNGCEDLFVQFGDVLAQFGPERVDLVQRCLIREALVQVRDWVELRLVQWVSRRERL